MSFIIDPPLLIISGFLLYLAGVRFALTERKKIAIGLLVVLLFISVSALLYLDAIPCFFPFICGNLSGSEFMFHSDITWIYKKDVPLVLVIALFALYPLWLYAGFAIAKIFSKQSKEMLR
jgi:hypothetical protein